MRYVYTNASKTQWRKATQDDKSLAKKIYNKCKKSTKKRETFTYDGAKIIMNALEVIYFPYDDNYGNAWYWIDGSTIEISIKQFNLLVSRNEMVKKTLKQIKTKLRLGKRPIADRIKAIHDYICEDIEYDYSNKRYASIYDALFGKKVICMGYSLLFKALCDISNVTCQCVNNDTHMWNRIMIDNEMFYLDATWDDALSSNKFFLQREDEFYSKHPSHTQVDWYGWIA